MNPRFTVGTRVRIVRATYSDQQGYNGMDGVVTEATPRANGTVYYAVRMDQDGVIIRSRKVTAIPEPEVTVHEGDRIAPAPVPDEINSKRAQAAKFAHDLLGNDVLLEDVLALAAFVAGEDGQVAPATITGDVHISTTVPQPTPPNLAADRLLVNEERNYAGMTVRRYWSNDDDVIVIGGYCMNEKNLRDLVDHLQAAIRVNDVEGPNPASPRSNNPPF